MTTSNCCSSIFLPARPPSRSFQAANSRRSSFGSAGDGFAGEVDRIAAAVETGQVLQFHFHRPRRRDFDRAALLPMPRLAFGAELRRQRRAVDAELEAAGRLPVAGAPVARPHPDVPRARLAERRRWSWRWPPACPCRAPADSSRPSAGSAGYRASNRPVSRSDAASTSTPESVRAAGSAPTT